jgi:hypothetical protein
MKARFRAGDRARRFLASTGSAPCRGTIVERYSGIYGLLEDGARADESQRRGWNATAACLQPLAGSRDPFAEQVPTLMRAAPEGMRHHWAVDRRLCSPYAGPHYAGLRRGRRVSARFTEKHYATKSARSSVIA